ncbi:MAG: sigma-70 family RNA polymerase sigma factor [Flavobacterium nitrogenifigens]|uniref:RNA polymerase sigma-70 factor, ECF subfamily n=1 Tax=Flavobacterium nitrogenifigens TaxID=1617283 RepID=A0A521CCE6_9FLAO|nr:sigma-70 family RNA polymerase sigma factor [Flavobacterium nitrogenifigens]KAF2327087.1 sigma-70 family RNA polymerase sigma factor [Flavobacterium nitrogenifigens]MDQ8011456.1 sigma-70 family RNA polymerase sigma factor [Flavobacterium nitrogenifigens]SMO57093.1 RNA polymerase sigma-70 factor, ECF subfamily [Flavobacterium nitrogenifigens]
MNLDQIIKGCIKQNRKSQEELYNLYYKSLFVISLKYCQNDSEAEDNLHDAFIEIFTNIKNFKSTGSFEGWMKRILINKAISRYKKSFFLTSIKDDNIPEIMIADTEMNYPIDYLLSLIQELPHQYRLIFNLYELDEYSHKEIAEMLSISESTSKSNLHRAKSILKEKITSKRSFHNYQASHGK